jgi:GNAT superfamily N-acetyltransferase
MKARYAMAEVIVRPSTPADTSEVDALLSASYRALMPAGYEQGLLEKLLPMITRANPRLLGSGTYYLALSGAGEIIGAGGWSEEQPGTGAFLPSTGHIRHFATHPAWLGRGVGRTIYDRSAAEAKAAGMTRLECYASLNALDFYAKLGFKARCRLDLPMIGGLFMPVKLMERTL